MSRTVPITRAGQTQPDLVEGVVLIDPATGLPVLTLAQAQGLTQAQLAAAIVRTADTVLDSTGQPFSPDACAHTYGYNASGLIVTDTATDGATSWVKTYTYNATAQLTGETNWVRA